MKAKRYGFCLLRRRGGKWPHKLAQIKGSRLYPLFCFPVAIGGMKTPSTQEPISLLVVDRRREYGAPASRRLPFRVDIHIKCILPHISPWQTDFKARIITLVNFSFWGAGETLALHIPSDTCWQGGKWPHMVDGTSMKFCTAISYRNATTLKNFRVFLCFFVVKK